MDPAAPPPWGSLQADALQTVFEALPDAGSRAACRLVCRRWHEVADQSPGVWGACALRRRRAGTVATAPPPLAAARALLARQRHVLRRLQLDLGAFEPDSSMPGDEALAAAIAAACGPGSGLTDLTLGLAGALPPCVAQALPGSASQLTALAIRPLPGQPPPSLHWGQLTHLRSLSSLAATADFDRQGGVAPGLTLLPLTRLRLHGAPNRAAGRPAGLPEVGPLLLACPTTLQRLDLTAVGALCFLHAAGDGSSSDDGGSSSYGGSDSDDYGGSSSGGSDGDGGNGGADNAAAPALAAAQPGGGAAGGAAGQPHAAGLVQHGPAGASFEPAPEPAAQAPAAGAPAAAPAAAGGPAPGAAQQGPPGAQHVQHAPWMREFVRLPAADLLQRWHRLEALRLRNVDVSRDVLRVLPSLPCLTSLHLAPRFNSAEAILEAQRCSGLQELTLARCEYRLPPLPPGALPQLTRLRISCSEELMKLHPSWCMLPALKSFELESCEQLLHLPMEVAAMDRLERLSFSHQRMEQLPCMLTGLSQLTRLAVAACSLEELPAGPYLRNLRELVLFANSLRHVPPALAHPQWGPSSLRRLDLSSNYSHRLSGADVAVLRTLSTLQALSLQRQEYDAQDAHPRDCLDALRAALPDCDVLA